MELRQLAKLIHTEWKPTCISEEIKKETDIFLIGNHNNPLQKQTEFTSSFYYEPEVSIPAEEFINS